MTQQNWSAMVYTTLSAYLRDLSDLTQRTVLMPGMLKNRGKISYRNDGENLVRHVKFALPETKPYTGGMLTFEPSDKYRNLTIEYIGLKGTDTMDELETLKNRGVPALIKRFDRVGPDLAQSIQEALHLGYYNDGNANPVELWGLETAFGVGTPTVAASDRIVMPNGVYGGRSTKPGAEGLGWTADLTVKPSTALGYDWPSGQGRSEFDYLSPRILRYNTTAWGTGEEDFLSNSERVVRQGAIWASLTAGKIGRPQVCLMCQDHYAEYANAQSAKQVINVPYKEVQDLGFENGFRQEGLSIVTEFGVPSDTSYLINFNRMELACMYDEMFAVKKPQFDEHTQAYIWSAGFFGNLMFEPKFQTKIGYFAANV